ncbi:MAG: acyl-CoA carboxylase subunit beta [Myxococcaceae bacterium]|nr:acyl-CoA carboxylase subunit beta [Myxococcaceae bacterium]MCA3016885.1 acyl-CoA carboxylase subunit beta [Myxococcaceae bacterium]
MTMVKKLVEVVERVEKGGAEKYHAKNREVGKLFARERIAKLIDPGSFVEEGKLANNRDPELASDGVVTGVGRVAGRPVAIMANDSTIKAGSWGARTVEKILRIQEVAAKLKCPLFYLVDSAGARITDQVDMFPGRRGAGRIFYNEVHLSGVVPQVCLLFGPSAAGGAYIPAFCDLVIMVDGNASMYLGSPRMAEMVIGEKVTLEEMGGAKMHCSVSGCGDVLAKSEEEAIALARQYIQLMPVNCTEKPPRAEPKAPRRSGRPIDPVEVVEGAPPPPPSIIPADQNKPFDMHALIGELIDEGSWFEVKKLFAQELITGLARINGHVVGIVANQPKYKGGVLFVDSADKAARFIWLCDAFNVPLLYLADVPGFMIGSKVERQGIIRSGAKMISAVSEASVPCICVVVRKAYGAGLYAMSGPGFNPNVTLALPGAMIAVMGPEAAVNAVYFNKIQEKPEAERAAYVAALREEYRQDVDLFKLASELIVDEVIQGAQLREELCQRLDLYVPAQQLPTHRKRGVLPV